MREYYRKPMFVEIQKDGMFFINRYTKPNLIPYGRIIAIGDSEDWRNGGILLDRGGPYMISHEIARNVREAYIRKFGVAPRIWDGRTLAKTYRRSIGMKNDIF